MAKKYDVDFNLQGLDDCFLWQYDAATKLKGLLSKKQAFYKKAVSDFWDKWTNTVFNIDTATTFGLNLWGEFLGVSRPEYIDQGQTIQFTDDQYRTVIKGRLMLMNSNGSVPSINQYLNYLFPNKAVFVVDYNDMSINLVFYYTPTAEELAIINLDGFLPRPAGVNVNYKIIPPDEVFGFYGQEMAPFDQGTFLA